LSRENYVRLPKNGKGALSELRFCGVAVDGWLEGGGRRQNIEVQSWKSLGKRKNEF
jgi:hypothetical protein